MRRTRIRHRAWLSPRHVGHEYRATPGTGTPGTRAPGAAAAAEPPPRPIRVLGCARRLSSWTRSPAPPAGLQPPAEGPFLVGHWSRMVRDGITPTLRNGSLVRGRRSL